MTEIKTRNAAEIQRPRFLTTQDVAELVRAQPETVRYWRQTGAGPKSFRLPGSRRVLYALEDVEAFIASARNGAA